MEPSSASYTTGYGDMWKGHNQLKSSPRAMVSNEEFVYHSPPPPNIITDFNMTGSYPMSPIDFEPLPNLFSFAPCSASTFTKDFPVYKEKTPHDMADVLLSLKHAFVHPGQLTLNSPNGLPPPQSPSFSHIYNHQSNISPSSSTSASSSSPPNSVNLSFGGHPSAGSSNAPQLSPASVSFSVHPHSHQAQVINSHQPYSNYAGNGSNNCENYLLGENFGATNSIHHPNFISTSQGSGSQNPASIFPSMSVNVSMNMTMGVPAITVPPPYNVLETVNGASVGQSNANNQYQSNLMPPPPIQMSYSANHHHHHHHHHPGCHHLLTGTPAGYSFTAEFRPSTTENSLLEDSKPHYNKGIGKLLTGFRPPIHMTKVARKTSNSGYINSDKMSHENSSSNCHSIVNEGALTKMNLCRICGKNYARPSTLKTHMRTHSGEKPYRCNNCDKSFSQAANLTAHVRTHSGEKPFRCPICDRRFSQSSSVTTHMRTHSGERPYGCRMCKKAFSDSSTLTKHLRIHSGEKPYQCKLCLLRFSQSGNLNRHMRVHSNSN